MPSSVQSSPSGAGLPRRMQVPPFPSHPHRKLRLSITDHGLLLRPVVPQGDGNIGTPEASGRGVLIRWGVKGKVEPWEGAGEDNINEDVDVELGGLLGLVRLWDAAYLMAFLPPKTPPRPIFAAHKVPAGAGCLPTSASTDSLHQDMPASSHEVYTLENIHTIPLVPELALKSMQALSGLQNKQKKAAADAASLSARASKALNVRWSIPLPGMTRRPAGSTTDGETDIETEADMDTDAEAETISIEAEEDAIVRGETTAAAAPETDDSPQDIIDLSDEKADAEGKKKFNIGWGMFVPKLPRKGKKLAPASHEPVTPAEAVHLASDETVNAEAPGSEHAARDSAETAPFASDPPQRRDLESKILRELIREMSSGGFFYSFDFDLTHTLQHKRQILQSRSTSETLLASLFTKNASVGTFSPSPASEAEADIGDTRKLGEAFEETQENEKRTPRAYGGDDFVEPDVHVPLWRRVDRRFFWNEFLAKDFIELGLHSFVLPVMQGWFQSSTFNIPVPAGPLDPTASATDIPVDLVVISRRSRERAGLRYQRRGIDDKGNVANMVETEMIVRATIEGKPSLFSFVQVRGSIPLRWSQSPYALKPVPVVDKPVQESLVTGKMHFDDLTARYGKQTIVNLSELTGKEGEVTNGYRELVKLLDRKDVVYEEFDFHNECKGMKYENIGKLVTRLEGAFANQGYYWACQDEVMREQTGTFRTNCIDCLDRTNVVQSAFARHVLSNMLTQLGLVPGKLADIELVFNDVWANNGDKISQAYAGTSALKGDFTRTGKRDLTGMWHDGLNSLARMYSGAVSDFFSQAVISFLLGHRNLSVFSEFLETLQSSEASSLIRLSRVRTAAIEVCSSRVLSAGESRLYGWTLLSPEDRNAKIGTKLEEKIVILSRQALYVVSFNFSLEKVIGFTRIALGNITQIKKGAYILSPLQEAGRDPVENSGLLISFEPTENGTRYTSYSVSNQEPATGAEPLAAGTHEFYALKALPREFVNHGADGDDSEAIDGEVEGKLGETCRDVVDRLVEQIKEQRSKLGFDDDGSLIVEEDIVGLDEAQRSTSIASRVDYALKRFLWL